MIRWNHSCFTKSIYFLNDFPFFSRHVLHSVIPIIIFVCMMFELARRWFLKSTNLRRFWGHKASVALLSLQSQPSRLTREVPNSSLLMAGQDAKIRFSVEPPSSTSQDSGFQQWLDAMRMVARLPGGVPPEFRRKVRELSYAQPQQPNGRIHRRLRHSSVLFFPQLDHISHAGPKCWLTTADASAA